MEKDTKVLQKLENIEGYRIWEQGEWATIFLDCRDNGSGRPSGEIIIASSFGTWLHYWHAPGENFKKFLAGLDIHYTAGKFGCGRVFDLYATMGELEKLIEEHTSDPEERESLKAESAALWDCTDGNIFGHRFMTECTELLTLVDGYPNIHTQVAPQFQQFWKVIWPVFVEQLKLEVNGEKG
jgi:hypothetical protein